MAGSALFFSVMSALVKEAGTRLPSSMMVLARGVVTLIISYGWLKAANVSPLGVHRKLLLLRGALGFGALYCYYYAVTALPLAEATVIQYTNPLLAAVLAAWFLGERLERTLWLCLGLGIAGVLLVAKPGFLFTAHASVEPRALLVALAGAALSGAAYVVVRRLAPVEHPLVVVFYFPFVAVPGTLPFVVPDLVMPTPREWLLLLAIGITTQIAQVLMTMGLQTETAGRATSMGYLQVVFAAALGWWLFGERPDTWTLLGALCIASGVVLLALQRRARSLDRAPANQGKSRQ